MSKKKHVERPLPASLGLPRTGVDSHAHLDIERNIADLPGTLQRAAEAGVGAIGQVFLSPEAYRRHMPAFEACTGPEYPSLFYILGIHPCEAMHCTGDTLAAMRAAFQADTRLCAVGEIGLDFYWKDCPPLIQEEAFRLQLALARDLALPVVIHSRDAALQTLHILESENFSGYPVLWHCFSGDAVPLVDRIVGHNWHVSIPGPVSYNANADLRLALARIPLDRLLVETDSPYLSPEPWRGKPNEPAFAVFTAKAMAEALNLPLPDLWTRCGQNALRFFGGRGRCRG